MDAGVDFFTLLNLICILSKYWNLVFWIMQVKGSLPKENAQNIHKTIFDAIHYAIPDRKVFPVSKVYIV